MALRDNLKRLRTKAGITGKEMAERIGISYASYMAYENPNEDNSRWPNEETLVKIASVLNISIDELLGVKVNAYKDATARLSDLAGTVQGFEFLNSAALDLCFGDTIPSTQGRRHLAKNVTALHIPPIYSGLEEHPSPSTETEFWYLIPDDILVKALDESEESAMQDMNKAIRLSTFFTFVNRIRGYAETMDIPPDDFNNHFVKALKSVPIRKSAHEKSAAAKNDNDA